MAWVFDCPMIHNPIRELIFLSKLDCLLDRGSSVKNIALRVTRVREDRTLVNALARCVLQIRQYRERWFSALLI